MAHVNTKHGKKYKYKNKNLLYLLGLITNTLPQLEQSSINSSPSSPPDTDHLLHPSLTPTPHLQKRKKQAATG